jgi:hypothetical protein
MAIIEPLGAAIDCPWWAERVTLSQRSLTKEVDMQLRHV